MSRKELKMKKVFLVEAEMCDYDEYDRITVAADSSQEALEIAKEFFADDQGEITAKEVDMSAESGSGVILASFCAG